MMDESKRKQRDKIERERKGTQNMVGRTADRKEVGMKGEGRKQE